MDQSLINYVISGMGAVFGMLMKGIWDYIKRMEGKDEAMNDRIYQLEVLIAGSYVKREELLDHLRIIMHKLDKIDDRLNRETDTRI